MIAFTFSWQYRVLATLAHNCDIDRDLEPWKRSLGRLSVGGRESFCEIESNIRVVADIPTLQACITLREGGRDRIPRMSNFSKGLGTSYRAKRGRRWSLLEGAASLSVFKYVFELEVKRG